MAPSHRAKEWGRITGSETDVCSDPILSPTREAGREPVVRSINIVLDTNIVLDLWVFNDPATQPVAQALDEGRLHWLTTPAMRDELARVLGYAQIAARLPAGALGAAGVMRTFERYAQVVAAPAPAGIRCADPDDQKFIDLAVQHQAWLLSKDNAILLMRKQLLALGVRARCATEFIV